MPITGNVRVLKDKDGNTFYPLVHQKSIFYDDGESLEQKESVRQAAEELRIEAEDTRIDHEASRVTVETARQTAESARSSAESTRISNESGRVSAETARASAETGRASAETARASAETTRVSAENNRQGAYNAMYTNPKGVKATYADLPSSGNTLGDSWHVATDSDASKNGHWRWNGTAWVQWYQFNASGVPTFSMLNDVDKARASMVRREMHSGVVQLSALTTGSTSTLNSFTVGAFTAIVNGNEVSVPTTTIQLDPPPESGTSDTLVFLETYFPADGNGYTLAHRIRNVSNVNFINFPKDGFGDGATYTNSAVLAQGGNASPLTTMGNANSGAAYGFKPSVMSSAYGFNPTIIGDLGVYLAGTGDTQSKTALATYDGYSYAIPLFRVKRRNSSGFSVSNPNGAVNYTSLSKGGTDALNMLLGGIYTVDTSDSSRYSVGATYANSEDANNKFKVVNIPDSTHITILVVSVTGSVFGILATRVFNLVWSDRPDKLLANVIHANDITDLRHRTQAQYNYDYELKRASDQFMRGEIGTSKKMMKVYHGIPKSQIDPINTVFYASLDGSLVPEFPLGSSAMNLGTGSFKLMPTGSGYKFNGDSSTINSISGISSVEGTIEFIVNVADLASEPVFSTYVHILDSSGKTVFTVVYYKTNNAIYLYEQYSDASSSTTSNSSSNVNRSLPYIKIRASWDATNLYCRINNTLVGSIARKSNTLWRTPAKIQIGGQNTSNLSKITMSDLSVSSINRGSIDYQLPLDFISGDAVIQPAYTNQRRILSEAQMTQTTSGIVKINNADGTSRGITTNRTTGNWTATTDTITVTGMAGELISGVYGSVGSATIVKDVASTDTAIYLDSVSNFADGDTVKIIDRVAGTVTVASLTIASNGVDGTNKKLTFTGAVGNNISKYQASVMEFNTTASVPVVSFMVGTTKTPVVGTWETLGTNSAKFTLGTNASLTTQDIQIDYSLIMPSGQPALIAPTTTTLMGESGIRVTNSTITADFANKVAGRSWENPNKVVGAISNSTFGNPLVTPSTTVQSLVTNGDFSNGTTGWAAVTSTINVENGRLKVLTTASFGGVNTSFVATPNNKYYISALIDGDTTVYAESFPQIAYANKAINGLEKLSLITTPSGTTCKIYYVDRKTSDWTPFYVDNVIAIDLTALYGAGNEPTKAECDTIFASYIPNTPTKLIDISASQSNINFIQSQNGSSFTVSASKAGSQAQAVIAFDLIAEVERKLGTKIPASTVSGKVAWLKSNLSDTCYINWWGYGSSPIGNKASLNGWIVSESRWGTPRTTTSASVTSIYYTTGYWSYIKNLIDSNGFVHFIIYAEPSDGVTPSVINTDYISLDVVFQNKILNSSKLVTGQTVHLRDDFAGKVAGSVVENPNKANYESNPTTLSTPYIGGEVLTERYNDINTLNGTVWGRATTVNGAYGLVIFSFNLIRMVEDKYGVIPAIDKVQWVKDNVGNVICNWWGYGTSPSNNYGRIRYWKSSISSWANGATDYIYGTSVQKISIDLGGIYLEPSIDSNGFVHFLAYADPSDGVTASTIYTDYVNLELTFKTSSFTGYDILSPENPRRDASLSNILFIRKETKEVQSMFPYSNEFMLATYSDYLPTAEAVTSLTDVTILVENPEFLVTDLGSAVGNKQGTHHYMNPAYRVGQDNLSLYGELGFSSVPLSPDSIGVNIGSKINLYIVGTGINNNYTKQTLLPTINKPLVYIGRWLCLFNGELKLLVLSNYTTTSPLNVRTGTAFLVNLIGKPLTKESDGFVRSGVLAPVEWRTNPLVPLGFVDKATNKIITT